MKPAQPTRTARLSFSHSIYLAPPPAPRHHPTPRAHICTLQLWVQNEHDLLYPFETPRRPYNRRHGTRVGTGEVLRRIIFAQSAGESLRRGQAGS